MLLSWSDPIFDKQCEVLQSRGLEQGVVGQSVAGDEMDAAKNRVWWHRPA
jgi:hypothetical protein